MVMYMYDTELQIDQAKWEHVFSLQGEMKS